ncbi:MAG: phenylalanine--tRNA ligase subunit alpha [Actinobacteria bacterium]|nr:phenylalanine--tRNA ligase subunit alpha [Actinomycetota bacterium]
MASIKNEALSIVESCKTQEDIEASRVKLLGKKGLVTGIFKSISGVGAEEKPVIGEIGNLLRELVNEELQAKSETLDEEVLRASLAENEVDVSLPGRKTALGHKHLITQVIDEIVSIFLGLGYRIETGPEVELDYYNFEALNTPVYHPARSLQDTFYIQRDDPEHDNSNDILLRTHTSPVQVRVMETSSPPLYVVSPGKAYRRDEIDATHAAMFFQVEGFAVDKGLNMGHLKGTLEVFVRKLFGKDRKVRFRPHFFPFTEPSAEVDVSCFACDTVGCSVCKGSGWLEILGCGMIDPNVLKYVGYDPDEFTGFAFGMGAERVAMMRYGIEDLRVLTENDLRFLRQF